jgi:hypothetical protein
MANNVHACACACDCVYDVHVRVQCGRVCMWLSLIAICMMHMVKQASSWPRSKSRTEIASE